MATLPAELPSPPDRRARIKLIHIRVLWAVWLAGVVGGSLASAGQLSSMEDTLPFLEYDKLMHFGAYAGLAILSLLAFERRRGIPVALSMILLGGLIELAQNLSPGRSPDIADAVTNALGVLAGLPFGLWLTRHFCLTKPNQPGDAIHRQ